MKRLEDLVGEEVVLYCRQDLIQENAGVLTTRLVAVEPNGIWIEGRAFAKYLEDRFKQLAPKMPIFFVPYAQVGWIIEGADYPYLSEKAFGISES